MIQKLVQLFRPLTPAEMRQRALAEAERALVLERLRFEECQHTVDLLEARIERLQAEILIAGSR